MSYFFLQFLTLKCKMFLIIQNLTISNIVIHLKAGRGSVYVYQNIDSSIHLYIYYTICFYVGKSKIHGDKGVGYAKDTHLHYRQTQQNTS